MFSVADCLPSLDKIFHLRGAFSIRYAKSGLELSIWSSQETLSVRIISSGSLPELNCAILKSILFVVL